MKSPNFDVRDAGKHNAFINGNMDFWQRGTTVTRTHLAASSGLIADRILAGVSGGASKSITVNRSTSLPTSLIYPSVYSYEIVNNTAIASFPAGENIEPFLSKMEGVMFRPLLGKDFTIGFWLFTSFSGLTPVSVRTSTHSYIKAVSVTPGWQYVCVNIPHHTSISHTGINSAADIDVGFAGGTAFNAPSLDSWVSGTFYSHSSITNWYAVAGATMRIAQIQVRSGVWAADDMRDSFQTTGIEYKTELEFCRRYCQSIINVGGGNVATGILGIIHNAQNNSHFAIRFATPMRVMPAVSNTGSALTSVAGGIASTILNTLNFGGGQSVDVTDATWVTTINNNITIGFVQRLEWPGGSLAGSRILFDAEF